MPIPDTNELSKKRISSKKRFGNKLTAFSEQETSHGNLNRCLAYHVKIIKYGFKRIFQNNRILILVLCFYKLH